MGASAQVLSILTFVCSALSLLGSSIVLCSYIVARTTTNPRAAQLIRNLAITDFLWFSASLIQAIYWVFTTKEVPDALCYICSPTVNFTRLVI